MNLAVDATTLEHAANAACRAALRAGLDDVDARDLAQDALVRALTSAQPPAGVPLPAWVYGIAKNLGRDHAKSAKRREVVVDMTPELVRDEDLTTVLAVRTAVEDLPPPLRDVITLHELEDNSLRETADALQIPFDTAKDRLRRAREQLRARLGDDDVASERSHTRKRAAAYSSAIVAGLYALLGKRSTAAAATGSVAAIAASTGARMVPLWIAGLVGGALLAGGFVAGRVSAPRERDVPTPTVVAASHEDPGEIETAVATPAEPSPTAAKPAARIVAAAAPPAAEPTVDNEEQLLLDRARAGLRRGMHDEALVTLMEHARRFADGDLAEERDVLIIEAYLRAGKPALAKRRIERYRVDHPKGVLAARVDTLAAELP